MSLSRAGVGIVLLGLVWCDAPVGAGEIPTASPEDVGLSNARLARVEHALRTHVERGDLPGVVAVVARRGRETGKTSPGAPCRLRG